MADERLRRVERQDDEATSIKERIRAGRLARGPVEAAAALGSQPARLALGDALAAPEDGLATQVVPLLQRHSLSSRALVDWLLVDLCEPLGAPVERTRFRPAFAAHAVATRDRARAAGEDRERLWAVYTAYLGAALGSTAHEDCADGLLQGALVASTELSGFEPQPLFSDVFAEVIAEHLDACVRGYDTLCARLEGPAVPARQLLIQRLLASAP